MDPVVSVCVVAFNQARYLRECLESIVSQATDFTMEVIVGDDCSTDGTAAVIDEFVATYPGLVRAIKHPRKVGGTANVFAVHNAAAGEFVAHMDGDDCMLPGKLRAQVQFLREHPNHSFVAHDVEIIDESSMLLASTFSAQAPPTSFDLEYLVAHGCFFTHSSKLYRRAAVRTRVRDRPTVDFYFHIDHALSGPIGYIDRPLGRYRRTTTGLTSGRSAFRRDVLIGHLDAYEHALQIGVNPVVVNRAKMNFKYVHAMMYLKNAQFSEFRFLSSLDPTEYRWATPRQKLVSRCPALSVYLVWLAIKLIRRGAGS